MNPSLRTFVIVGAGQAGRWLALTLRAEGHAGRIVMIGAEAHAPYERPPLSKAVLKGEADSAQLTMFTPAQMQEQSIEWWPGETVTAIDRDGRRLTTDHGRDLDYDTLFLATGGQARTLPGLAPHPRVAYLRSLEDALRIKGMLDASTRVLVLGGGWIGLEVAATARMAGKEVTVVEAMPRLCQRTVPPCVSDLLLALHRSRGNEVCLGTAVTQVLPDDTGVTLTLADGQELRGDVLVAGLGLIPGTDLATQAGLAVDNGIVVNAEGRSSDPHIFAAGDVANAPAPMGGQGRMRLESWSNAQLQAVAAAKAALGKAPDAAVEPPWFWSDQFDANLQILGLPAESHRVVQRVVPDRQQHLFFFCDDAATVRAVAAVNAGREVKVVRRWMTRGQFPDLALLADPALDLQRLPVRAA